MKLSLLHPGRLAALAVGLLSMALAAVRALGRRIGDAWRGPS